MSTSAPSDDLAPAADQVLDVVPAAGAAISTLGTFLGSETVSASNRVIARVDELQFDLGEGPCWDALASAAPVLEPDVREHPRRWWAAFSPALDTEVAALFAFPMRVGPLRVGAVDLYDSAPRELTDDEVDRAMAVASEIARQVLRRAIRLTGRSGTGIGLHSRRRIHQATGFVIAQLGVSAEDAELLIQGQAFAEGRTMQEVADDLLQRRRRFTQEGDAIEDVQ